MTEIESVARQDPVSEMRHLIRDIHQGDYTDAIAMTRFIALYDAHAPDTDKEVFYEKLDSADVGLEFYEGTFDEVVDAYDRLGGSRVAISFPETGRTPSYDWAEELSVLENIFATSNVEYGQSHALYVRKHARELQQADESGVRYQALLANQQFLSALTRMYEFELTYTDTEHLPDDWPAANDGFLESALGAIGYEYANSYREDWWHDQHEAKTDSIIDNLKAVVELEAARPGAVSYLSQQYGIRHFSRYPIELLAAQFDNGGRVNRSYGVIIGAVDDHNGALAKRVSHDTNVYEQLYDQARETHDVLVAEAETSAEFERRLKHFDNVNGAAHKIDFAFIKTHGSPNAIIFGAAFDLGSLAVGTKLSDVHKLFTEQSSIVMSGCSTGRINGIAQSLSSQFNTVVVAPPVNTDTRRISFIAEAGRIRMIPEYLEAGQDGQPVAAVVYKNGSPLGSQKTADYLKTTPNDAAS